MSPFQDARLSISALTSSSASYLARLRAAKAFQCHTGIRHQFGNSVDKPVRMPQYTADIADNRFCRHRTEGNNRERHHARTHFGYVINHAVTFFSEIDASKSGMETRSGSEAFEQEVELQWIQIGIFRGTPPVNRHGTTSRPYRHIVIRPLDKLITIRK